VPGKVGCNEVKYKLDDGKLALLPDNSYLLEIAHTATSMEYN